MKKYLSAFILLFTLFACSDKKKDEMAGGGVRPDGTYFNITVDGQEMQLENIHYARTGKNVHLVTWGKNGFPNLNVTLTTKTEEDFRSAYTYTYSLEQGTSIILWGVADSDGYESHWWDCPPSGEGILVPSPGTVNIENIEREGGEEFITGSFNVEVYQPRGDCPYAVVAEKKITAKFRLKKAK